MNELPQVIEFQVLPEDVEGAGTYQQNCPIARALNRTRPGERWWVGTKTARHEGRYDCWLLDAEAFQFRDAWDSELLPRVPSRTMQITRQY